MPRSSEQQGQGVCGAFKQPSSPHLWAGLARHRACFSEASLEAGPEPPVAPFVYSGSCLLLFKAPDSHAASTLGREAAASRPRPPGAGTGAQALPEIGRGPRGSPGSQESARHQLGCRRHRQCWAVLAPSPPRSERLGDGTERSLYPRGRPRLHSTGLCRPRGPRFLVRTGEQDRLWGLRR